MYEAGGAGILVKSGADVGLAVLTEGEFPPTVTLVGGAAVEGPFEGVTGAVVVITGALDGVTGGLEGVDAGVTGLGLGVELGLGAESVFGGIKFTS